MFRIGQKVVCVDAGDHDRYARWPTVGGMDGLQQNAIYTIRRVGKYRGTYCLWLDEIIRPVIGTHGETGYATQRFRPVVEKKTDISVFEEILRRETVDDRAPAKVAD